SAQGIVFPRSDCRCFGSRLSGPDMGLGLLSRCAHHFALLIQHRARAEQGLRLGQDPERPPASVLLLVGRSETYLQLRPENRQVEQVITDKWLECSAPLWAQ